MSTPNAGARLDGWLDGWVGWLKDLNKVKRRNKRNQAQA